MSAVLSKMDLSRDEVKFLEMVHNPTERDRLMSRLERLSLLSSFLAAERGWGNMNEIQIFNNPEFGEIRTVEIGGER